MKCEIIDVTGSWGLVQAAAYVTAGKDVKSIQDITKWKRRIVISGHSPIRMISLVAKWTDIPYWVTVHLVRHHVGFTPFVRSQRPNADRGESRQGEPISMIASINAQAVIDISRVRLCYKAARETMEAWKAFVDEVRVLEPEIGMACVPSCVRYGYCPEPYPCNKMSKSEQINRRAMFLHYFGKDEMVQEQ